MITLKQFRNKYKLTQKQLAAIIGTTPATLSKYENGYWTINQAVIDKIAELYGEQIRPVKHKSQKRVWAPKGGKRREPAGPRSKEEETRDLTGEEISKLRSVLGKESHSESDWDFFEQFLPGKTFYTASPAEWRDRMYHSEMGILKTKMPELAVFTSQEALADYIRYSGDQLTEMELEYRRVSWEQITEAVKESFMDCLIDPHCPQNGNVLGLSGESGMITIYSGREFSNHE